MSFNYVRGKKMVPGVSPVLLVLVQAVAKSTMQFLSSN